MRRRAFLASGSAALCALAPGAAGATGGLDVGQERVAQQVRVLLAAGTFAAATPLDDWHFAWNGASYRGGVESVTLAYGRSGLVNTLPLDAYLYGVVSREVSASWPRGAQEAQAIVARTYALGRLRPAQPTTSSRARAISVTAASSPRRSKAGLRSTRPPGQVVTYLTAPARVAYGSCCGGHSADAASVWGTSFPYLRGVADPNCAGTPEYRWQLDLSPSALATALAAPFTAIGDLQSAALRDLDDSGRPREIALTGSAGSLALATRAFRDALGTGVVRSTFLLAASVRGGALHFDGAGRGHGVGLCQWGARVLGAAGRSAADIVAFYFPGTALGKA